MVKITVSYGPGISLLTFQDEMVSLTGLPTIGTVMLTESELRTGLKTWLEQRARHRRLMKFVDPGMT